MTLVVCGIFFTLSKLKHRADHSADTGVQSSLAVQPGQLGGAEQASLLKRTQETARGHAETVRLEREVARQSGSSFDETGDAFRRRATPEPMQRHLTTTSSGEGESRPDESPLPSVVPSLRIHGRKVVLDGLPSSPLIKNPFDSALPMIKPLTSPATAHGASDASARVRPVRFVPFGRLIKAELVITLESTQEEMPLVGLVIEPVYNNGRLVIPAGTELHSMARADRVRNRIVSITTWRMVFPREGQQPNGRQITFDGMALDRDDGDGNGLTWGITDGSYGLRGREIHQGQTQQELMLFVAEALRAASGSVMDRETTIAGSQVQVNARNAGLSGGQAVLEHFADRISKEIERNGVYIQVPAGKQFYVYPRQVIDPDRADIPQNIATVE